MVHTVTGFIPPTVTIPYIKNHSIIESNSEPINSNQNKSSKFLWLGLGCLLGALLCSIICLFFTGFAIWIAQEPQNVTADVVVPISVSKGEEVLLEILIKNTSAAPATLNSIDIDNEYLDGLIITSTRPAYKRFDKTDLGRFGGFYSYYFEQSIPGSGSYTVTFVMKAIKTGDYTGSINICIDSGSNCLEKIIRTVVE